MCLHAGNESAGSDLQPEFIYHHRLLTILNNIRTKCETGCAEDLMGQMKGWTQRQLPVSPVMYTEGVAKVVISQSEVDGFAKGCCQVCFSEGL